MVQPISCYVLYCAGEASWMKQFGHGEANKKHSDITWQSDLQKDLWILAA